MTEITTPAKLISPAKRMQIAPVTCTKHSVSFGWHGFRIEDYSDLPESDFSLPGMNHHLLVYHYKALDGDFTHFCAGKRTTTRLRSGQFSFIPAGADNSWTFGKGNPSALHILVEMDCFERALGGMALALRDEFQFASPVLEGIARRLRCELVADGISGVLFAETMMDMLCRALATEMGGWRENRTPADANITPARNLIDAEFERAINLEELAVECDLSQSQLLRAFKAQVGISPHQYLLSRRIEAAKHRLLQDDFRSLADIAAELGFSDQSHFTRIFRRATSVTPRNFQRVNQAQTQ